VKVKHLHLQDGVLKSIFSRAQVVDLAKAISFAVTYYLILDKFFYILILALHYFLVREGGSEEWRPIINRRPKELNNGWVL